MGGVPVNGPLGMRFTLWATSIAGTQIGGSLVRPAVPVDNGLFTVDLDFGIHAYNGNARWLQIEVCSGCSPTGPYQLLSPRQSLAATPFALQTRGIIADGSGRVSIGTRQSYGQLTVVNAQDDDVAIAANVLGDFGIAVMGQTFGEHGIGVWGIALDGNSAIGVYGQGGDGFAGYFIGKTHVGGEFTSTSKFFLIDHPLDPANQTLRHASVESAEQLNMYSGNVQLDSSGSAWVAMPDWFDALNTDVRYQMTPIGAAMPDLHIAQKLTAGRFQIAGGRPGMEVSWQITAVRNDPYVRAHPMKVEELKPAEFRGRYYHPEEHGMPKSMSMDEARKKLLKNKAN